VATEPPPNRTRAGHSGCLRGRCAPACGSGGPAGVLADAAHCGPVPVGHGCGGGRCCCRPSSVTAAAVSTCPCGGRWVSAVPGASWLPVSGRPPPVSAPPDSRDPPAASTWHTRPAQTKQAQPARHCRSTGTAPAGPQPAMHPNTAAGVRVAAEPDTADATAVRCCFRNRGRCPDGRGPPRTPLQPADTAAVQRLRGYRKRSPGRRPVDRCRHCR
jgi:hypothetical protein